LSSAGSSSCQALEHATIILKLTGSISTFGEGSDRRTAFVSGLAAILKIPEAQIVIISVTEGSVIVELGFLRLDAAQASPTEIVLRLKAAATSGELEKFGLTDLTVGQEAVLANSSVNTGLIVGASIGGVVGFIALLILIRRWWLQRSEVVQFFFCPFSFCFLRLNDFIRQLLFLK
jgi:hypothetical protein